MDGCIHRRTLRLRAYRYNYHARTAVLRHLSFRLLFLLSRQYLDFRFRKLFTPIDFIGVVRHDHFASLYCFYEAMVFDRGDSSNEFLVPITSKTDFFYTISHLSPHTRRYHSHQFGKD